MHRQTATQPLIQEIAYMRASVLGYDQRIRTELVPRLIPTRVTIRVRSLGDLPQRFHLSWRPGTM